MGSSFNALFCTAPIPASKINELLQHAQDNTMSENMFCLVQSPTQKRVDKPTNPPVSDFESGFQPWSIKQLGEWCKKKFDWNNPKTQPPYISAGEFAVLDERTLKDGTVLLVKYDRRDERINPEDPSDRDEAFRKREGYREVRVKMEEASEAMAALQQIFLSEVLDSIKPDESGVKTWKLG